MILYDGVVLWCEMIVRCKSCCKRYQIDDDVIGSKGQHVRCTLCGNIWFQEPALNTNNAVVSIGNLPALIERETQNDHSNTDSFWMHAIVSLSILFIAGLSSLCCKRQDHHQ